MNQLTGRFVVIVLSVREGRGFIATDKSYLLEGTLNGRKIVSDPVESSVNPLFCTELVWEIEKKEIRKLRSSHTPLRIECFVLDGLQNRDKIGFVLLHLRSARPVISEQLATIEYKWNKLLGVHTDYKALHPQLALTLTIRDQIRDAGMPMPLSPGPDTQLIKVQSYETLEPMIQDISVVYLEEGYIQIGDGENTKDTFSLSFLLETGFNFDLLVSKKNLYPEANNDYFITLQFFDLSINSKKFGNLHEPILLNDKIVFKLHSSIEFITQYFQQCKTAKLKFCQGTEVLGTANIHLHKIDTKNFDEQVNFKTKYEEDSVFTNIEMGRVPDGVNGRKPFISTQIALVRNTVTNEFYTFQHSGQIQESPGPRAFGDSKKNPKSYLEIFEQRKDGSSQTTDRCHRVARSTFTNLKDVAETNSINKQKLIYDNEDYHLYSLIITLMTIEWKKPPKDGFQFRFLHPKANTVLIVQCNSDQIVSHESITLEDVKCNQFYISTSNYIATLIYTYPCKIIICNSDNKNISEQFDLYTKLFLTQNTKITEGIEACTCSYFAMISDENNEEDVICELQIQMTLQDLGLRLNTYEKTCFDLEPIVLDERLAFKTLNEINVWKNEQQKRFEERQRCLESERLKLLNADWEAKRIDLETKLKNGIEKCRVLSEELVTASRELENKKKIVETQCKYKESPEIIEMKVTEMLEQEMNMKLSQMRKDNIQLLERVNNLTVDKDKLKEYISKKEGEFEEFKRSTLTEEQTSNLLQELRNLEEKYRQELNAKDFFKEQWQKAVREVHLLKSEDQKQIQQQIKKKKNELSQLSLQDFDKGSESSGSSNSLMSCPSLY